MALVRSVEQILITIPTSATSNTGTLTKGQIDNKCVPFTTVAVGYNGEIDFDFKFVRVTISGSTVTATRSTASSVNTVEVIIYVVEFTDECTVTTGEATIGSGNLTVTDTIALTDLTRSFVYMTFTPTVSTNDYDDACASVEITNTTTLTFTRQATGQTIVCRWYTVECDATQFDVQRGSFLLDGTNNTAQSAAFTAVDMARTMVIGNFNSGDASARSEIGNCTIDLVDSTHVRARRANDSTPALADEIDIDFQVIQFAAAENISVQRGEFIITGVEDTDTITAVDLNRSMAHSPGGQNNGSINSLSGESVSSIFCRMDLEDSTTVRGTLIPDFTESVFSWEVIEWSIIPIIETFTVENVTGGGQTSVDLTPPAGIVENDMIIIVVAIDGDAANPQAPDFVQFGGTSEGDTELYYLIKRATASEPVTYDVTWTGAQAGRFTVLRISGVLQSGAAIDTIDVIGAGVIGLGTTGPVAAITSTEIDTLAICAISVDSNVVDAADGFSDAQGFVEEGTSGSAGGGAGVGQIIGSKDLPAIGSSLSPTFGTWSIEEFATRMFNLKPVPAVVVIRTFSTAVTNISAMI